MLLSVFGCPNRNINVKVFLIEIIDKNIEAKTKLQNFVLEKRIIQYSPFYAPKPTLFAGHISGALR